MRMRVLALETTDAFGSVALLEHGVCCCEMRLTGSERSTSALAPAIAAALEKQSWRPDDVALLAVARGPGSFTGLRVGITLAKTLAWTLSIPLVGVDTLDVLAEQADVPSGTLHVILDAQRQELFVATFARAHSAERWQRRGANRLVSWAQFLEELQPDAFVTGPALALGIGERVLSAQKSGPSTWRPTAAAVGELGRYAFLAGQRDDPFTLSPAYGRHSYAEEANAQTRSV
jgi:tRNA threonylcarbamoyladenosine biosynthesis protein TsaB